MKNHKILYGVCGIGNGHTHRQLPLIEYFSPHSRICIFAYDVSFEFYSKYFKGRVNILVVRVAVPFYVGNKDGIDFEATKNLARNNKDYAGINGNAVAEMTAFLDVPDFVISDYEPVSAVYSYGHGVPLVTIDQQSKYLFGEFPRELRGQTYADEVARLKMFFPAARARIACSFFGVVKKADGEDVRMFPPIIKKEILEMKNNPSIPVSILIYISSQKDFLQSLNDIARECASFTEVQFHVFAPQAILSSAYPNVYMYTHGDGRFNDILKNCAGIVSTAGHTLLSEAMHLVIPVYAIALPLYEQHMNAEIIAANNFGMRSENINKVDLGYFISHLDVFRNAIRSDTSVLLKGDGVTEVIAYIEHSVMM